MLPPVAQDTKVREASAFGKLIWEYAPESQAVIGYANGAKQSATSSRGRVDGYLHLAEITAKAIGQG